MSRNYLFADESGNFDFRRAQGASRYFILTSVTLRDCSAFNLGLHQLRHQMAWEGFDHPGPFHAAHDPAPVRERVFSLIDAQSFVVDALILEKAKAMPRLRETEELFYQHAWFYLMKYVVPRTMGEELLVVTASLGSKKKRRSAFYTAVQDVMRQIGRNRMRYRTACWESSSDSCLQMADYCGWAIQRKWEAGDPGPHTRIASKIRSEYDLFARGTMLYY